MGDLVLIPRPGKSVPLLPRREKRMSGETGSQDHAGFEVAADQIPGVLSPATSFSVANRRTARSM